MRDQQERAGGGVAVLQGGTAGLAPQRGHVAPDGSDVLLGCAG